MATESVVVWPGMFTGDQNGGAELAQRARKGQQGAGEYAASGQRQRDGEEDAPFARAQRPGPVARRPG